ncbi:SH3 domain-containing protein [Streptomyces sp. NPDC014872]|uniref:SH3 domain-containing protein n=1 Tax=Streptomyces sp. NPDC014872 TaxID=3364926 RepID=UPI0036FC4179
MAASSAVALLAATGATLVTAPAASAADSSSCNSGTYGFNGHINTNSVNLRSGPGTSYSSKGLLSKGTKTYFYCYRDFGANKWSWDYIKVTSGPHKGVKGWVRGDYDDWF